MGADTLQGGLVRAISGRFRLGYIFLALALLLLVLAAIDLGMQHLYHTYLQPPLSPTPLLRPTATRTPRPSVVSTALPTPSPTAVLTQTATPAPLTFDDLRLQEALRRILFRQQMLKASLELLRAEDDLDSNQMKQVERELIAVSATLEQAGRLADESLRDSIAVLQRDLSRLREDLYLRPERLREGIRSLWQRVDVLIGE